ncbi:MAG: DNA mismatch repair endonuclease MutL [Bacteroidales bacterium]|jgi:DNA mismatch repair protein MutL|nr:DNA mismatch repair endonuclease MutL [Bacteroidales bacterium]
MLKLLPANISNLIAAGEVVGRPASVVKELLENSIDAGADTIQLIVTDAGRTLIQVIDNGSGMTPGDAELCFERHATSKIDRAEDLESISTYGFRGEALASIAAVAHVTLKTRQADSEVGWQVEVSESRIISSHEVSSSIGSSFEVRNLFYNVPARRKFLKSDNTELRHIIQEFIRVAVIRPDLRFKMLSNGKVLYDLRTADNTKQRIYDLFGRELINSLVEIYTDTSVVKISGHIGKPESARKTPGNQYFFVNGRYFRSPYMHKAVMKAYEQLIPDDTLPTYFIFLETPLDRVDVNIHPTKSEVKFEDEQMIFEIIMASVRESLGKNSFVPSIDFDTEGMPEIPNMPARGALEHGREYIRMPRIDYDPLFNPFDIGKDREFSTIPSQIRPGGEEQEEQMLFEEREISRTSILRAGSSYILSQYGEAILLVHTSRARERIWYERYLSMLSEEKPLTQQTLFPRNIQLQSEDYLTLAEHLEELSKLGFDIRDFGGNSVAVYGVPLGYSVAEGDTPELLDSLVASLREQTFTADFAEYGEALARKLAISAARSHTGPLSDTQAQILVDELFDCKESGLTPDGHKCMSVITVKDLEKYL